MDAEFLAGELKAPDMRCHQVYEEQRPDEIAARKHNRPLGIADGGLPDEPAFEIAHLGLVQAFVYLRQRADKYKQQPGGQQHNREPERTEEFDDAVNHWENARIEQT